jgi:hypothetical protein
MSIDLTKLTPAPWFVSAPASDAFPAVVNGKGFPILLSEQDNLHDLQAAALARNALDVMLRRGWAAKKKANDNWVVDIPLRMPFDGGSMEQIAGDPFTALVEADRWYAEHVEGKQ